MPITNAPGLHHVAVQVKYADNSYTRISSTVFHILILNRNCSSAFLMYNAK